MLLTENVELKALEQERELLKELDKGIDDMESGRITPHKEAMKKIRESIGLYGV